MYRQSANVSAAYTARFRVRPSRHDIDEWLIAIVIFEQGLNLVSWRAGICIIAVPNLILLVFASNQAAGETASEA